MHIVSHEELAPTVISRITTRKVVTPESGAQTLEMWEQHMPPDGHIPPHYHECEEIITILAGTIEFKFGDESQVIRATTTLFIPPREIHSAANAGDETVHLLAVFAEVEPRVFLPDGTLTRLAWQTS